MRTYWPGTLDPIFATSFQVDLSVDPPPVTIDIQMVAGARLTVSVVDEAGHPVAGAAVSWIAAYVTYPTVTGANGWVTLPVRTGQGTLAVSPQYGHAYVLTYFPSTPSRDSSPSITIAEGVSSRSR